jgi:hypothetical protein
LNPKITVNQRSFPAIQGNTRADCVLCLCSKIRNQFDQLIVSNQNMPLALCLASTLILHNRNPIEGQDIQRPAVVLFGIERQGELNDREESDD